MTHQHVYRLPAFMAYAWANSSGDGGDGGTTLPGTSELSVSVLNAALVDSGGEFEIYHVTNENTSGAGSYPHAVNTSNTAANGKPVTRIVVFDICGGVRMPPNSSAPSAREAIFPLRSNLFVAGETAPTASDGSGSGFNVHGVVKGDDVNNVTQRHMRFTPSVTGAPAVIINGEYEGGKALRSKVSPGASNTSNHVFQNCDVRYTIDTAYTGDGRDGYYVQNVAFVNCTFAQGLSDAITAGRSDFSYGHQWAHFFWRRTRRALIYGSMFSGYSSRCPYVATGDSILFSHNYLANCGSPGSLTNVRFAGPVIINTDKGDGDMLIEFSKVFYHGMAQSNPEDLATHLLSHVGNDQNEEVVGYFADNLMVTNWARSYTNGDAPNSLSTNKITDATIYSGTFDYEAFASTTPQFKATSGTINVDFKTTSPWGDDNLYPWSAALDVRDVPIHVTKYAGATPTDRDENMAQIWSEIAAETTRVADDWCPTFNDPTLTTRAVDVPYGLGTTHLASGDSSHAAVAGYDSGQVTPLEQWLHGLHMVKLGIPDGASDYDPDVAGRWIATTDTPTLAGVSL